MLDPQPPTNRWPPPCRSFGRLKAKNRETLPNMNHRTDGLTPRERAERDGITPEESRRRFIERLTDWSEGGFTIIRDGKPLRPLITPDRPELRRRIFKLPWNRPKR
jgi:hypothetical protein